jgi:hypothetical protein
MKKIFFILALSLFLFSSAKSQNNYNLPDDSLIIETQSINSQRELILWMQNPQRHPRQSDEAYTCPDYTRGSYYEGFTEISLFNTKTQKIINTVRIQEDGEDNFDIPYLIERHYYKVPILNAGKEGKPKILSLQDFNGDGHALEFVLFDAEACMGLETALFGYDENLDKVIQYPVILKTDKETNKSFWAGYLFSEKPVRKGFWKFQIDYRGRGGTLDKYEYQYDKATRTFYGTIKSISDENQ